MDPPMTSAEVKIERPGEFIVISSVGEPAEVPTASPIAHSVAPAR